MIRASKRAGDVTCRFGGSVALACTAALMTLSVAARATEPTPGPPDQIPQPWVTMSLKSLGVPSIPPAFMQSGASMLTLDMVDNTHMLLTFSSRGLVPRVPDDPPDDEDRMVAAELVELPTCKILARADWHMHDHGRYLWRLGKGRFLVRTRHDLFVITPRARMETNEPLRPMLFPTREGTPVVAVVSPDKAMVMVETMAPKQKGKVDTPGGGMIVTDPRPGVMIDFYRMSGGDAPGVPFKLKAAGAVKAPAPVMLPMDADGYLWPTDSKHGTWPVSFNEFGGREVKIASVNSSCPPRLQMVSRSQFLAFTCKGSEGRVNLKSYGLDGHETWEETLSGTYGTPELAFAPEAGRFALSRIISPTGDLNFGQVIPDGATQEVRIYQTESGDMLLKVPTTPVTRYAENFDLTEDGMVAAVVNAGVIQVYKLPPLSMQDTKDLADAKAFCPPASQAPVRFARLESAQNGAGGTESESAPGAPDVAAATRPDMGGTSGGGNALPATPMNAAGAPDAEPGGLTVAPPGAEVTKASGSAEPPAATDSAVADPGGAAAGSGPGSAKADSGTKAAVTSSGPATKDEVTKGSSGGDPAASPDAITDAAALAALGKTQAATKAAPPAKTEGAKTDAAGDADTGPRKPPTLLEPGENPEKAKSPQQQQQSK